MFKGGTSLSKVWKAIRRFSEDIDITYDIRGFAPDLVAGGDEEALPPTRSQERRWTRAIRPRLAEWVHEVAQPLVEEELERGGFPARVRVEAERLYVAYEPLFIPLRPMRPEVQVDFGARSTGEPHVVRTVVCDAAAHLPGLGFPEARPAVMLAERTFWEKATSMHVYCLQGRVRGERWSRHWHDLVRLDDAGIAERALADRDLALSVARHKAMFFRENDSNRQRIDYLELPRYDGHRANVLQSLVSANLRSVLHAFRSRQNRIHDNWPAVVPVGLHSCRGNPFSVR